MWAEAPRDILKLRVLEMAFPGVFTRYLFGQNKHKTGNNAIETSQAFHDIASFELFIDLNLFKYLFNVIEN